MKIKPCGTIECSKYRKGADNNIESGNISNCARYYMSHFNKCSDYKPEEEMKNEKKITELQNKLNKAVENVEAVREELEQLKKEPKIIMVPDNIHLSCGCQILFNDDIQLLCINYDYYTITATNYSFSCIPHKLIECEELEKEKIYYHSRNELNDIDDLRNYGIYDGKYFIFINDKGMPVKSNPEGWDTILQAVPMGEN